MKSATIIRLYQDQDSSEENFQLRQGAVTGGFKNPHKWTTDSHPFELLRKEPTVTRGKFFFKEEESNMATLKKRFKQKLGQAKILREKVGDPIALGRSIIEIPEDKADEILSQHKGYKYVSKKS